jgi:hypothetical protein
MAVTTARSDQHGKLEVALELITALRRFRSFRRHFLGFNLSGGACSDGSAKRALKAEAK